jgi:hypothetical protein
VVRGDREYPMAAECSDQIAARIPVSKRIIIPGADHLLPLRDPGRLAQIIAGVTPVSRRWLPTAAAARS